jgi:hypothetical protein
VSWVYFIGRKQPEQEDRQQHQPQHQDRTEPRRADRAECGPPGDGNALLAPSAHFIEAHRRNRADKREAGCERKQQRQHLIAEGLVSTMPPTG